MGGLIEIAHFYEPEEAYCAKGYLQSLGIETIIQNEHHLATNPMMRVALGGYPLLAASAHAEEARFALANIPEQQRQPRKKNWFWLPVALSYGVPFVPTRRESGTRVLHVVFLAVFYAALIWGLARWLLSL